MLSIGDVADQSGVPASALRYYEKEGLLPPAERKGGQRRYSPDILFRIRVIKMAQQAGFQVNEILTLLEGFDSNVPPSERWREMAQKKRMELEEKQRELVLMQEVLDRGLRCTCLSWDECFLNVSLDGTCDRGGEKGADRHPVVFSRRYR
ncbi:MerR family transcriptional regulator [Cohnella pontilimi]|uniref:MerR family transcriptional regulator n=1 Tax=Cohnella pontilimi TaxID=2564100 RepID=A0A4U0FGT2_9BACL|nr:MerR family transcriptional regulator [Cohnella pontilimi]TJY44155.1 MerR family transcriptional regulator [Cohnella pontilimi]